MNAAKRRSWWALLGPACLVSVGYMDPGNWATDLEGGARFGYSLLWVLVASNVVALLLQSLSAKLGLVTGTDLASACRANYSPGTSAALWILAELAIVACDLAEVMGSALALNLLFGLPLVAGALLTSIDVLLILAIQRRGAARLEAMVAVLLLTIAICLAVVLLWARPAAGEVAHGLVPHLPGDSLYVAIGMLGATVMPHNLYLHSGLLAAARRERTLGAAASTFRRSSWSTALALNLALLVNAAILLLSASAFGQRNLAVTDLRDAYHLLTPLLGTAAASVLFAVGLLCSGQSSTVTGTLAGQIVMEGFVQLKLSPWLRRALTRGLAIGPAVAVLLAVGDRGATALLVGSQIVLSIQLPFAIVPLIRFTSAPQVMGHDSSRSWVRVAAAASAALITFANVALVLRTLEQLAGTSPTLALLLGGAGCAGLAFLGWVCCVPLRSAHARGAHSCPVPLASSNAARLG
ncbi:MAG TPA: Nramp family divalent metal transporter [Polyangiaceae bacterium]|nr:Nramp family divalent metal transporter [Polyangiaceae bacterium]